MRVVLLAGGLGTRLREETEYRPKPMVEIGGRPILWHIMKNFAMQGHSDFVLCLGYKGELIKDYFLNYESRASDITISLGSKKVIDRHTTSDEENWNVTLSNTGQLTPTGGRIHRIKEHLNNKTFICTYGDGVANIDISKLLAFHKSHGKVATVTAVNPTSRFGSIDLAPDGSVLSFQEKPKSKTWINGGFFVFEPKIFDYLDADSTLELEPLKALVADKQLSAYRHQGFWQPMDTYRETLELNKMWEENEAPWKNW